METVISELMYSLNDVHPVSPTAFYATNDHRFGALKHPFLTILCDTLKLRISSIMYYEKDGQGIARSSLVCEDKAFLNGIVGRGKYIYVAETLAGAMHIFERVGQTGELELKDTIRTDTKVDNVAIDESGEHLYVGAHPKELEFVFHAMDEKHPSPSEVVQIKLQPGGSAFAREKLKAVTEKIYISDGTDRVVGAGISASSVAIKHKGKLLIGGVFDSHMVLCQ